MSEGSGDRSASGVGRGQSGQTGSDGTESAGAAKGGTGGWRGSQDAESAGCAVQALRGAAGGGERHQEGNGTCGGRYGGVEPAVLGNHVGMASGGRWSGTRSDVERVEMENPLLTSPGDAELRHGTTQNPPRWGTGSRTPWGHRENFGDTMGTPQTPIEPHNCDLGSSFRPPETP